MSARGGTDEARPSAWRLGFACISPLAAAILLVNDEMAQPVQDVSLCGVPMLGTPESLALELGGGRTDSGNVFP